MDLLPKIVKKRIYLTFVDFSKNFFLFGWTNIKKNAHRDTQ